MTNSGGISAAKLLAMVAAGTALTLALSACAETVVDEAYMPGAGMDTAWQAEQFSEYYAQEIEWYDCGEDEGLDGYMAEELTGAGFDLAQIGCALIAAPIDWEDPANKESIELSIVHIPSTSGEAQGTLFANPGGPGETGVDFMLGMALSPGFEEITANYDLLGFDPRGMGGSSPIDCDGGGFELPALQLGECMADNPLTHTMGTSQVARDMELMRTLVGDEQLNFLGYSYGTMLGATYASLFPERVGRLVLDSAESAGWASPIHFFDQSVAASNAAIALATACTTEYDGEVETCPFTSEQSLMEVIESLNRTPMVATDGTLVDGWGVKEYLFGALYQSHFDRGRSLDTIALALFGEQEAIDEIGADAGGTLLDFPMTIVGCHSFPIEPDIPGLLAHVEEVGMPLLLGGPEINDTTLEQFVDLSCYSLPESGLDFSESFRAPGAAPILVIGITGDHATPYQHAETLTEELESARLLTLEGQGHAASYDERSDCIDNAVTKYLLDGTLPAEGTVCTAE